jgi:hypothetical protein
MTFFPFGSLFSAVREGILFLLALYTMLVLALSFNPQVALAVGKNWFHNKSYASAFKDLLLTSFLTYSFYFLCYLGFRSVLTLSQFSNSLYCNATGMGGKVLQTGSCLFHVLRMSHILLYQAQCCTIRPKSVTTEMPCCKPTSPYRPYLNGEWTPRP